MKNSKKVSCATFNDVVSIEDEGLKNDVARAFELASANEPRLKEIGWESVPGCTGLGVVSPMFCDIRYRHAVLVSVFKMIALLHQEQKLTSVVFLLGDEGRVQQRETTLEGKTAYSIELWVGLCVKDFPSDETINDRAKANRLKMIQDLQRRVDESEGELND